MHIRLLGHILNILEDVLDILEDRLEILKDMLDMLDMLVTIVHKSLNTDLFSIERSYKLFHMV